MSWRTRFRALMAEREVSQSALSRRVGRHQSQLSKWLGGDQTPTVDQLAELAGALGITMAEVFAEDGSPSRPSEGEQAILSVIRVQGLSVDDAIARLLQAPLPSGPARPIGGGVLDDQPHRPNHLTKPDDVPARRG